MPKDIGRFLSSYLVVLSIAFCLVLLVTLTANAWGSLVLGACLVTGLLWAASGLRKHIPGVRTAVLVLFSVGLGAAVALWPLASFPLTGMGATVFGLRVALRPELLVGSAIVLTMICIVPLAMLGSRKARVEFSRESDRVVN